MFYSYNRRELKFSQIEYRNYIYFIIFLLVLIFGAYTLGRFTKIYSLKGYEREVLLVNMDYPPFTEEELIDLLKELHIKFPHIVLAQSYLESSYKGKRFNSPIFRHNHNLFGMKEAKQRITTALGTKRKHAYYQDWTQSVYDYGYYQASFLGKIKTEEEYFRYLGNSYAEDPNYLIKIKKLSQELKEKF